MERVAIGNDAAKAVLSRAMVAEGRFAFVSGQGPLRNGVYEPATMAEETQLTLENLAESLRLAGSSVEQVVSCRVFLADIADIDVMNEVYTPFFPPPRPARTTIQAAALPGGIKVEIDCIALVE